MALKTMAGRFWGRLGSHEHDQWIYLSMPRMFWVELISILEKQDLEGRQALMVAILEESINKKEEK